MRFTNLSDESAEVLVGIVIDSLVGVEESPCCFHRIDIYTFSGLIGGLIGGLM